MESTSSTPNAESEKAQSRKTTAPPKPKKKKDKDHGNPGILRRLFGKTSHQNDAASCKSCSGAAQKRGTFRDLFRKKQLTDNSISTSEFKLLHLQTISSSRTLRQEDNESQIRPFFFSDHNSTQTSSHALESLNKARQKPFTLPRREQEAFKLIRNEDILCQVSRSTSADIGKDNTINNSIATQQSFLVADQETDTALFRKYYQESGMQSELEATSEETIMPKSSCDTSGVEEEEGGSSVASSTCSTVLAPKNSQNNMKTPEAGDKATPQVEKTEEPPVASVTNDPAVQRNTEQALVPYEEDTLRILLTARSKLLAYLEKDDSAVAQKVEVLEDNQVAEVAELIPEEDSEGMRRKVRSEALTERAAEDEKVETYKTMQSDIKDMITDLLLKSSEIKGEALNAGVFEDDSPPLICDFLDSYYSSASADVAYILDCIMEKVDEAIQTTVGVGDADDVKSTLRQFLIPTGKNNVTETYFCTTSFDRIPKTSWSFGGSRKKSKFSPESPKEEDDVLLRSLEGCYDLLTGLFGSKEQFVCMVHNGNMKKSEKNFDLRSDVVQSCPSAAIEQKTETSEEQLLNSVKLSLSSSSENLEASKKIPRKITCVASSSSDESVVNKRPQILKRPKQVQPVKETDGLSGYDGDQENGAEEEEAKLEAKENKRVRSKQELNTAEEIKKIEENVAQNETLERKDWKKPIELSDIDTSHDGDSDEVTEEAVRCDVASGRSRKNTRKTNNK